MAIVDTTFLIDLMKESKVNRRGKATALLEDLIRRGESLRLAIFSIGELYVGVAKGTQPAKERAAIEECLELFDVIGFEESTARIFGAVVGDLKKRGQIISDMDALIASVALEHDELVVTRNPRHFERVVGLRVEGY